MKKYAWTLAELMMAMIFIMVISGFLISNFKPASQNAKIKIYATIRNLEKGIIAIDDKYEKMGKDCTKSGVADCSNADKQRALFYPYPTNDNNGTFCKELADVMNLQSSNCDKSATGATANLVFANGIAIYGLLSTPKFAKGTNTTSFGTDGISPEAKKYAYMDIGVDIDGSKGLNRVGVDRFPLRIFPIDNQVLPVNCASNQVYNWRQDGVDGSNGLVSSYNPYCYKGTGFGAGTGTNSNINFQTNVELITYDTFVNEITTGGQVAKKYDDLVAYSKPFADTVCGIFGGKRFYNSSQCSSNTTQKTYFSQCPTSDKGKKLCYSVLHRPSAGLSAVVQGMVGSDLDMD